MCILFAVAKLSCYLFQKLQCDAKLKQHALSDKLAESQPNQSTKSNILLMLKKNSFGATGYIKTENLQLL